MACLHGWNMGDREREHEALISSKNLCPQENICPPWRKIKLSSVELGASPSLQRSQVYSPLCLPSCALKGGGCGGPECVVRGWQSLGRTPGLGVGGEMWLVCWKGHRARPPGSLGTGVSEALLPLGPFRV